VAGADKCNSSEVGKGYHKFLNVGELSETPSKASPYSVLAMEKTLGIQGASGDSPTPTLQ